MISWFRRRRRVEVVVVPEAPQMPVRACTRTGKVSHLLGPDGAALCPNLKALGTLSWMTDPERLAALPPCRACEHAAGKAAA